MILNGVITRFQADGRMVCRQRPPLCAARFEYGRRNNPLPASTL
jgi:hypothetical protein